MHSPVLQIPKGSFSGSYSLPLLDLIWYLGFWKVTFTPWESYTICFNRIQQPPIPSRLILPPYPPNFMHWGMVHLPEVTPWRKHSPQQLPMPVGPQAGVRLHGHANPLPLAWTWAGPVPALRVSVSSYGQLPHWVLRMWILCSHPPPLAFTVSLRPLHTV